MADTLQIKILSFSYRDPPILNDSHDGGGFVFDCRCLPNPGREEQYKLLTGQDSSVQNYLCDRPEIEQFFDNARALVDQAIANYRARDFVSLYVWFGCTGGQHRSVYLAERLAEYLKSQGASATVRHRNLEAKAAAGSL